MMKERIFHKVSVRAAALLMTAAMTATAVPYFTPGCDVKAAEMKTSYDRGNYELVDDVQDSSILHCWNWSYKTIEENLELIAQSGYSAVQTSPAQQPKDYAYGGVVGTDVGVPGKPGSGNWWKLYQPVTFSVCDNGQTWLGTKEELKSLCKKADEYGIKVIVDIVANHMGNIKGWKNSLSDVTPQVGQYWNKAMLTDGSYWHINDLQVWMSDGRRHITQGSLGMPDLNTANKTVQGYVADYLKELIDCGVDGFRFDAAKHIETPDDAPDIASDFWPAVLNAARNHYRNKTGKDLYVYGEILNTVGDNFNIGSYTKYMSVTDNSSGNHLLEAVRNNNVSTLGMNYDPRVSVLWAESHDTYMNESSRYASDKSIVRTWALVANKDNAASLFFARPYYSSQILSNDVDGAMRPDLDNVENARMGQCATYTWASCEVAAINHFNNRFKNCNDSQFTDGNIAGVRRGDGIIIVKFDGPGYVSINSRGMSDGVYTDEVSGKSFTVSNGKISGNIESQYGIAVIYKNTMPNPQRQFPVKISADVSSGTVFYSDEIRVKVTISDSTKASYTTSQGDYGTLKNGVNYITVGKNLVKDETVTLTIVAGNSYGEKEESYTYIKGDIDLTECVFLKNANNWSEVTVYMWRGGQSPDADKPWPGEKMFCYDSENKIYAIEVNGQYENIIFSENGRNQTKDLVFEKKGQIYDPLSDTWTDCEYGQTRVPVVKIDPGKDTVFTDTIDVTVTVQNADTSWYQINDGEKIPFTGSQVISIGEDMDINTSKTVTVTADNSAGDAKTVKVTFTKSEKPQDTCIFLNVNKCTWFGNDRAVTAIKTDLNDSYERMSSFINSDGTLLYYYNIPADATNITIARILPNGNYYNEKTLTINTGTDYFVSDENLENISGSRYTGSLPGGGGTDIPVHDEITVYFTNNLNWSDVYLYTWGDDENLISWPGFEMVYAGLNEYNQCVYKAFIDARVTGIVFSNGAGTQTVDINSIKDGMGYYILSNGSKCQVGTYMYGAN